ncbi:MAG: hypothetical protein ACRD1U_03945 [Vicinamibacterales bacterium]
MIPPLRLSALGLLAGFLSVARVHSTSAVDVLKPVAALPAHIAGSFQELTSCQQATGGEYFIFDRRAHSIFVVPPSMEGARKLIEIGTEPGRILDPTAFDMAPDDTFVVADAPHGQPRFQRFLASGSTLSAFLLEDRAVPRILLGNLVMNGIGAVEYTGRALFVSQPEHGALITEYSIDGRGIRSFGELRATGQESDRPVHVALNAGLVIALPDGGFYFVFLAGVPQFRKYNASGRLLLDRHVQGPELDDFIPALPNTWKRRKTADGEIPVVAPSVYAAGADRSGALWISLAVGTTFVYDAAGEKRRSVRFRAAGELSPRSFWFTANGRVLVTPGCYAFPV